MCAKSNIIDELRKKLAQLAHRGQRGVILQPGALGDCILTLPLAALMKETVAFGGVDIIGRTEYIGILPGRSCIDGVKSLETIGLHRLFVRESEFALADPDPLIMTFAEWTWITTFLGEADSDFEHNLIFTAHCSHSAEVMTLKMKPQPEYNGHITDFYKAQFIEQSGFDSFDKLPRPQHSRAGRTGKLTTSGLVEEEHKQTVTMPMIKPTSADILRGKEILAENGVMPGRKPVVIQPGSGGAHKCWHLDNFLSAAKILKTGGVDVLFLLGPAEMERFNSPRHSSSKPGESALAKIVMTAPRLTSPPLAEVVAVLSNAAGYLGNDSGVTHLAAAMGVRTVAVFGPTDPVLYAPLGPAVTVLKSRDANFTEVISRQLQQEAAAALIAASRD